MRAAKWLAGAVAALMLALGTMWAIGSLLPVRHRATVSATLPADAETVWHRIDDVGDWPTWRDVRVEVLAADSVRVMEKGRPLLYRIERPAERTLVTEIATAGLPYGGRWTWSVAPTDNGSATVTIVEDGEVYSPVFRFFSRFVFGYEATMRDVLHRLEASLEPRSEPGGQSGP